MPSIEDICQFLESFAPTRLAEDWDNVGLLAGDRKSDANKVMTCLTITPASAAEAIERGANLIVAHHPLPFRPLKKITTDSIASKMVWDLIRAGVAIYSPHTGFDSAKSGINQMIGQRLGLQELRPLHPIVDDTDGLGAGRIGTTNLRLPDLISQCKKQFGIEGMHVVFGTSEKVHKVAIACGSGGSFLSKAIRQGCDTFITGETTFHTCLESESSGVNLLLLGHYASERFAVEVLSESLNSQFNDAEVWASQSETDPLKWV